MRNGSSVTLQETLKTLTGSDKISADALMEYYEPLTDWLKKYLDANDVEY